jgi:hypothetical protein
MLLPVYQKSININFFSRQKISPESRALSSTYTYAHFANLGCTALPLLSEDESDPPLFFPLYGFLLFSGVAAADPLFFPLELDDADEDAAEAP